MSTFSTLEQQFAEQGDVSENVAEDIIEYFRGNIIGNEEQAYLTTLQYTTGYFRLPERYVNSVAMGPPAGGKTHVQGKAVKLFPDDDKYQTTSASNNALVDDPLWDYSIFAPLDEFDKISKDIREYMKSMAGEDGGFTKKRNVENEDAKGGYAPETISSLAMPFQFLYAPVSGKGGIGNELQSRMLKLYVEDNRKIREAIGRKEFGHDKIQSAGYDNTYIYETDKIETALRRHFRGMPTDLRPDLADDEEEEVVPRTGGFHAEMPQWVWYSLRPIFDEKPTQTNRTFGMVANLIRASAAQNYKSREEIQVARDGETVDALVVHPQDVANVCMCQPTLLSSTHNLNPLKRDILKAVRRSSRMGSDGGDTTLERIRAWLEDNDLSCPRKQKLREILQELAQDYFIRIYENAGEQGAHLYEWREDSKVDTPRLYDLQQYASRDGVTLDSTVYDIDVSDPYDGCDDPIRDQSFKETVEEFDEMFRGEDGPKGVMDDVNSKTDGSLSMADAMGGSGGDDESSETQATLDGSTSTADDPDPDRGPETPSERLVYNAVSEACGDGAPFAATDGVLHYMGILDDETFDAADVSGTPADPDHEVWQTAEFDEERVQTEEDAKRELNDVLATLKHVGLVVVDETTQPDGFVEVRVTTNE